MPFGNVNVVVEMQGKDILEALENGVSQVEGKAGRFPQVSGLCFSYDASQLPGQRIFDACVQEEPLDLEKIYKIATVDYMFHGGDGYNMFKGKKLIISPLRAEALVDVVADYIRKSGSVGSDLDGRITVKEGIKRLDEVHFFP
jgi:5'-nucleotidase